MIQRLRQLLKGEKGSGTTLFFAALMSPLLLVSVGLTMDGSAKMDARREATLVAGEAARAAGQALDSQAIQGQYDGLDIDRAATAARSYLAAAGVQGSVSVSGRTVTVAASIPWQPRYLPLGGETITESRSTETIRS